MLRKSALAKPSGLICDAYLLLYSCHELRNPLNAISNSAELLAESLNRFVSRQLEWKKDPVLAQALSSLEADMQEDLEAVETILLSSRHQKRIADGKLFLKPCIAIVAD
jgi:signal transduction histidine kinase